MAGSTEDILAWTARVGLTGCNQAELMAGYCDRLVEAGLPIWRASIGADALHPLIVAQGHRWMAGSGVEDEFFLRSRGADGEAEWQRSPWYRLIEDDERELRRHLAAGEGTNEFPLLAELAEQGATDYWARILDFGVGVVGSVRGLATSWATREPAGFAERDLALLDATLPSFALAFKATMATDTARILVTTYLGNDAAERILRGDIVRGKVETVHRVLWFSDLIGFTKIADTLPREQLLELLNAYTDCLVGVVDEFGGEVLKFIGDGVLAAFSGDKAEACQRALDAAGAAKTRMAELNAARSAAGQTVTGFTLALHEGEVLYGNVGSRARLDFTVVGPAVNEVARIQAMSRSLDQPILISEGFAAACTAERERLISVGRYALRGVGQPQELFTLEPGTG